MWADEKMKDEFYEWLTPTKEILGLSGDEEVDE